MRRNTFRLLACAPLAAALALAPTGVSRAAATTAPAESGTTYGEGVSGTDTIPISELLAKPEQHVGKTVRVEGRVIGVCEMRGCWMELASDEEFQSLRIKVDDGVIVFPLEAKGKTAVAEGKFAKVELSLEQTRNYLVHEAEEKGETLDPETVTEPLVFYQIQGTGAVIR